MEKIQQQILDAKSQLNDLSAKEAELSASVQKERFAVDHKISQARLRIKTLTETRDLESRIVSSRSGRILEIYKNSGKVISTGDPMISIEVADSTRDTLSAFLYFSPGDGKKIRQGMEIRISPSTVKMEEHGYMLGEILQVSGFPASRKGMERVLQNPDLVASLSEGGAPIAVTAKLLADPAAPSCYRWSSGKGPDVLVESGTLCTTGGGGGGGGERGRQKPGTDSARHSLHEKAFPRHRRGASWQRLIQNASGTANGSGLPP